MNEIDLHLSKSLFNEVYYPHLMDYAHPIEIYYGGSGSGKSVFVAQKILYKSLTLQRRKVLVIRKNLTSQRESCWRLFLELLSKWKLTPYCQVLKSEYSIILPNGNVILFKGLDDPEKIKSIVGLTDVWAEEATELTKEDYTQLRLRLRAQVPNLQLFLSFNPISKSNWVYKEWFEKPYNHFYVEIIKTTYKDNKFLPQAYIESLEQLIETNPIYYKIYAKGEFVSLNETVYTNWSIEDFDYTQIQGTPTYGLDFGFSLDPTALIQSIVTTDTIYIYREWVERGKTNNEIANAIKALSLSKSTIIADSAEPKSIEELKRDGIYRIRPAQKGPDSIRHGIDKIKEYKIIVHPSCTNTITELENYSWQKDKQTGEYINKPIDCFNHCLDALRYSMEVITNNNKLKSLNKSLLGL